MAAAALNGAAGVSSSGPAAAASGAVLQAAAGMYEQLKGEWNRKSPNLSKCGEELGRLKVRGVAKALPRCKGSRMGTDSGCRVGGLGSDQRRVRGGRGCRERGDHVLGGCRKSSFSGIKVGGGEMKTGWGDARREAEMISGRCGQTLGGWEGSAS